MRLRRTIGVLIVILAVAVPELLACGDKFLIAGRGTRYQRPKNVRAASVLIYANPTSAMGATIKKEKIESLLKLDGHHVNKAKTLQELSASMSGGRYDVILTANGDRANVQRLLPAPDASDVIGVDDLLKNHSLLEAIDKAVLQRDQNLKKTVKR
jgi:hypothetical protein